ncbi:CHC2 zinc finger domain-containing protein [Bacillota bacterium Meth-B3]
MNVFEAARQINCVDAATQLRLPLKHCGSKAYTCCLFHTERTPSMCLYSGNGGFYCFGCHEHGDSIRLYQQALHLSPLEAAKQICSDFGMTYDAPSRTQRKNAAPPLTVPRMDARKLASTLTAWREGRIDTLLVQKRDATRQMDNIEHEYAARDAPQDAVWDDKRWLDALTIRARAQDEIARLDAMSLSDLLEEMKSKQEESYESKRAG